MKLLPLRITNLRTGTVIVQSTSFNLAMGVNQVFRSGSVSMRADADVYMQDMLQLEIRLGAKWVALAVGQVVGVTAGGSMVQLRLRSAGDILVDSHVEPLRWGQQSLASSVIRSIAEVEFGIPVQFTDPRMDAGGALDVFTEIAPDFGTAALGLIIENAKKAGWILLDDAAGRLVVSIPSEVRHPKALIRGVPPFVDGSLSLDDRRVAVMYGNAVLPGEQQRGKTKAEDLQLWTTARDAGARANTKQYFRSRNATNMAELESEIARKINAAAAQGMTYTCTVDSLVDFDGSLWVPNRLIQVVDEKARLDAVLLISGVTLSQSADAAQQAILTLSPPALYRPESADAYVGSTGMSPVAGIGWWKDGAQVSG